MIIRAFLILGLFLGSYSSQAQSLSDLEFGDSTHLDIISWNLEWFPLNDNTTLDSLIIAIEALQPDIIAIQEIDDANTFYELIDSLPDYEGWLNDSEYLELAYLYNTQSVEVDSIYEIYTGDYFREFPREPLLMEFTFDGEFIVIINNHLKCCGDGFLNTASIWDEETRRRDAVNLLKAYVDDLHSEDNVILTGDFNDDLAENFNNVFTSTINDSLNFRWVDMNIASDLPDEWSYPSWPSHLDHFAVTNELFYGFDNGTSTVETIMVEDELAGGFSSYSNLFSDHRAMGLKLFIDQSSSVNKIDEPLMSKLYPNPASTQSTLQANEACQLLVYDSNGRIVHSSSPALDHTLNSSELGYGLFIIEVIFEDHIEIHRLILTDH